MQGGWEDSESQGPRSFIKVHLSFHCPGYAQAETHALHLGAMRLLFPAQDTLSGMSRHSYTETRRSKHVHFQDVLTGNRSLKASSCPQIASRKPSHTHGSMQDFSNPSFLQAPTHLPNVIEMSQISHLETLICTCLYTDAGIYMILCFTCSIFHLL